MEDYLPTFVSRTIAVTFVFKILLRHSTTRFRSQWHLFAYTHKFDSIYPAHIDPTSCSKTMDAWSMSLTSYRSRLRTRWVTRVTDCELSLSGLLLWTAANHNLTQDIVIYFQGDYDSLFLPFVIGKLIYIFLKDASDIDGFIIHMLSVMVLLACEQFVHVTSLS